MWLSGLLDYAQAAEVLTKVGQLPMSTSSVWRCTQRWGERCQAVEAAERATANALPSRREPIAGEARETPRQGAALDGVMINVRGEKWKELKVGCVFQVVQRREWDPDERAWVEVAHAVHNDYVAHLGGPTRFGQALWALAYRHGWTRAKDTALLGDGAVWIWNLVHEHFYDSRQIVDWYHADQHLFAAAGFIHGEGTPAAHAWQRDHRDQLFQGHADQLAQELLQAAKRQRRYAKKLRAEAGYFRKNQRRMQYQEFREEGWPIGSGMVESGGKQFRARFAGPGMRWSRTGAQRLLPIRAAILSGRFPALWAKARALALA